MRLSAKSGTTSTISLPTLDLRNGSIKASWTDYHASSKTSTSNNCTTGHNERKTSSPCEITCRIVTISFSSKSNDSVFTRPMKNRNEGKSLNSIRRISHRKLLPWSITGLHRSPKSKKILAPANLSGVLRSPTRTITTQVRNKPTLATTELRLRP